MSLNNNFKYDLDTKIDVPNLSDSYVDKFLKNKNKFGNGINPSMNNFSEIGKESIDKIKSKEANYQSAQKNSIFSTATSGFNMLTAGLRRPQDETVISGDLATQQTVRGVKDGVASALGPIGQGFNALGQGIQSVGDGIGGETGAAIAGIASPEEGTIELLKSDADLGTKIFGALLPGGGSIYNYRQKIKAQMKKAKEDHNEALANISEERKRQYFDSKNSEQMKIELDLLKKANGYGTYNS